MDGDDGAFDDGAFDDGAFDDGAYDDGAYDDGAYADVGETDLDESADVDCSEEDEDEPDAAALFISTAAVAAAVTASERQPYGGGGGGVARSLLLRQDTAPEDVLDALIAASPAPGSLSESVLFLVQAGIPPREIASELGVGEVGVGDAAAVAHGNGRPHAAGAFRPPVAALAPPGELPGRAIRLSSCRGPTSRVLLFAGGAPWARGGGLRSVG